MITEFSKNLHDFPTSPIASLNVGSSHALVAVDTNPNYMWLKETWQNFA